MTQAKDIQPGATIIHPTEVERLLVRVIQVIDDEFDAMVFDGEVGDLLLWVRRLEGIKKDSDFQLCVSPDKEIEEV